MLYTSIQCDFKHNWVGDKDPACNLSSWARKLTIIEMLSLNLLESSMIISIPGTRSSGKKSEDPSEPGLVLCHYVYTRTWLDHTPPRDGKALWENSSPPPGSCSWWGLWYHHRRKRLRPLPRGLSSSLHFFWRTISGRDDNTPTGNTP